MRRNYCFTLNNYTQVDLDKFGCWHLEKKFTYCIFGFEEGTQGTPHLQGYMELAAPKRLSTMKNTFGDRFHWEGRRGTQQQAIEYCKKDGDFYEWGEPKQQGLRTDLDACRQLARDEGMRAVSAECNYQQIRTAEKFLTYNEEPRDWEPEVFWFWGRTGVGKSRLARAMCDEDTYIKNTPSKWWDGYDGHTNVIIDDFRDSWWCFTEMLSLLDRYEKQVEVKGGNRQFKPRVIIVTSCYPPHVCYKNLGEDVAQLVRRVTHVTEVGGNTNTPTSGFLDPAFGGAVA